MASIEIIVRDDEGNIINHKTERTYDLGMGIKRISSIEAAVEQFKIDSLPEITYDILADAQNKEKGSIKKDFIQMQWMQQCPNKDNSW